MTLKEFYDIIGGDYEAVVGRMMRREELVKKFVLKFAADKSYEQLCAALDANDGAEAFRAAHTIKGVCQNLSFDTLYRSSAALTEALRDNVIGDDCAGLFENVKRDYDKVIEAIAGLQSL